VIGAGRQPSFIRLLCTLIALVVLLVVIDYAPSLWHDAKPHDAIAEEKINKTALWVFAHPDDAVLNAGAAIIRHQKEGYKNIIVMVTSGDKVPEGREVGLTPEEIMVAREKEERAAFAVIGIDPKDIIFLHKLDLELTVPMVREEIKKLVKNTEGELFFRGHSPYDRYSEFGDAHPDHTVIGQALLDEWKVGTIHNLLFFRMGQLYENARIGNCPKLSPEELELKQKMRQEYTLQDHAKGRYGLGGWNAAAPFEKTEYQPECSELPPQI
jgi:LmbE family N-acetylglucosaminyl deacetylase